MITRTAIEAAQHAGQSLTFRFFWSHDDGVGTLSHPTDVVFSQWFPAPFAHEGIAYPTAEHWMMAGKARLFGDTATLERILRAVDPREVKALGRQVQGFDHGRWSAACDALVAEGNTHKFQQHPALHAHLLATADAVLVEASPLDTVWGIGLAANDPDARVAARWRGENRLGFALMRVRAALADA